MLGFTLVAVVVAVLVAADAVITHWRTNTMRSARMGVRTRDASSLVPYIRRVTHSRARCICPTPARGTRDRRCMDRSRTAPAPRRWRGSRSTPLLWCSRRATWVPQSRGARHFRLWHHLAIWARVVLARQAVIACRRTRTRVRQRIGLAVAPRAAPAFVHGERVVPDVLEALETVVIIAVGISASVAGALLRRLVHRGAVEVRPRPHRPFAILRCIGCLISSLTARDIFDAPATVPDVGRTSLPVHFAVRLWSRRHRTGGRPRIVGPLAR